MFKETAKINFDKIGEWNIMPIGKYLHRPKLSINPNFMNNPEVVSLKSEFFNNHTHANVLNNKRYNSVNQRKVDNYHQEYEGSFIVKSQWNNELVKDRHNISQASNIDSANTTFVLPDLSRRSERKRIKISQSS